jgi:hypothetical protein
MRVILATCWQACNMCKHVIRCRARSTHVCSARASAQGGVPDHACLLQRLWLRVYWKSVNTGGRTCTHDKLQCHACFTAQHCSRAVARPTLARFASRGHRSAGRVEVGTIFRESHASPHVASHRTTSGVRDAASTRLERSRTSSRERISTSQHERSCWPSTAFRSKSPEQTLPYLLHSSSGHFSFGSAAAFSGREKSRDRRSMLRRHFPNPSRISASQPHQGAACCL